MSRARVTATLLALATTAAIPGCGGRHGEPDVVAPTLPRADDSPARARSVTETFRTFGYAACASKEDCAAAFARAAHQDVDGPSAWNPRAHMDSPDVEWLVEWPRLPSGASSARYVYAALALGAVHRSWAAYCDQAYDGYRKDLDARLAELEPKLARLRIEPNPYDRIGGVLALEPDKPKKGALGEFVKGSDPVRYAYEAALYDAFNDTNRTFVYAFDGYAPSDELVDAMRPRQPVDYERDAFCVDAARGAVAGVDPLPDTSSWDAEVREMVKSAIPVERAAKVETRRTQLALQVKAKFKNAMTKTPSLPTGIREISVGTVTGFERSGRAARLTITQTREDRRSVDGVTRTQKIDEISTVDFKDWPSGVVLEPGDSVSFYGAELTVKDTIIKSTPELEHLSRQRTVDGRHVTKTVTKKDGTKLFFR